ncbi:MAG: transposase zinc-binding domain-containing protein, partial [Pseudomonadales bacterium]|nr:transposase zinc-binding domain-containing protein [Pseudomonadales bacterium]
MLREFRDYLRCGRLEHGFVRVKCTGCRNELLVAFSCKRRGFCPCCGGRRMAETSAHLIDRVLPEIPIRQWVLSFPWPLRLLYSTRPETLSRTLGIVNRAIESYLIRKTGLTRKQGARSGAVTFIQRFGSALNLNVHLHMLIPDGVYTFQRSKPQFQPAPAPTPAELNTLLDRIITRVTRHLLRDGFLVEDAEQPYLDLVLEDTLDAFGAASIQYRVILGPHAGHKTLTLRDPTRISHAPSEKPFTASRDGFSLNAAVACQPWQRQR